MQRSKSLALMFVLGAVLVGGVLGFSADRMLVRDRLCSGRVGKEAARAEFAEKLDLTADQRAAVDTILDEKHRQISAALRPVRPQLDSISETARAQIASILSPEQRARLDAMHRERKSRADSTK